MTYRVSGLHERHILQKYYMIKENGRTGKDLVCALSPVSW